MTHSFIFDVDGTLTPSRGTMNKAFKELWKKTLRILSLDLTI